jgi:hypothetical protein
MTPDADAISNGFDSAMDECGLAINSPDARAALGRLVALELASYLGLRPARRSLAIERHATLGFCARHLIEFHDLDNGAQGD